MTLYWSLKFTGDVAVKEMIFQINNRHSILGCECFGLSVLLTIDDC